MNTNLKFSIPYLFYILLLLIMGCQKGEMENQSGRFFTPVEYIVDFYSMSNEKIVQIFGNELFTTKKDSLYFYFSDFNNDTLTFELRMPYLDSTELSYRFIAKENSAYRITFPISTIGYFSIKVNDGSKFTGRISNDVYNFVQIKQSPQLNLVDSKAKNAIIYNHTKLLYIIYANYGYKHGAKPMLLD